ncbi:hypothetical protein BH23CHL5_BH23CHL5_09280 [soil metagenome]
MRAELKIASGAVNDLTLNDSTVYSDLDGTSIQTRELETWANGTESVSTGVWECEPGRFQSKFEKHGEFIHVISGELEATADDGTVTIVGAGDSMTFPPGWSGEWHVRSRLRKLYCVFPAE